MRVHFHKDFRKKYHRLPKKIQDKFDERLRILITDAEHPLLNIHQLQGERWPLMSMNVTGDYQALYTLEKGGFMFREIGTHSELYE
jgi:mRNA-degrading endonuclease YafQ of YafQ-DinJ toxin-antitoxin module